MTAPFGWPTWRDVDGVILEFLQRLKNREFSTTFCEKCGSTFFPPQSYCPDCLSNSVSWRKLEGKATLYSFTQIDRSFRFAAPDVIGLVEIEGVKGRVLSRIDAPLEELEIGMELEVDFLDIGDGYFLHQFKPVKMQASLSANMNE